jgi:ADP-heptose:LPS heptosyltransferase
MRRGSKKNRLLDLWVGTPLLNLLASLHRRRGAPVAPHRIGVMCSPALGDTLLFSAALQDLRSAFPAAHIVHLCFRQNLAAAEILPGADERLLLPLTSPWRCIRPLRAQRLDVLLDFTSWQRLTAFLTMVSGARYTVGFRTAGQHRSRGYDCVVEHSAALHEVDNFRALLRGSGLQTGDGSPIPTVQSPAVAVPDVHDLPFAAEPNLVVLHLWASGQRSWLREWPQQRWVELAQRLAERDTLFVVTGAPDDLGRIQSFVELLSAAGLRAAPFVSPDGFRTLTHLLRRARLVVSVNTGVMHLAAIAGARVLSLNGPNRNGRWGPVGPRAVGVEAPGEGCGFLHLGFNFDGHPTDCMERISVDQVFAAAQQLLARAGDDPALPANVPAGVAVEVR